MKKIIILSQGFIQSKGVYGPVLSPFNETLSNISDMLARNIEVHEVLKDNTRVKLSFSDLDKEIKVESNEPTEIPLITKPLTKPTIIVKPCNESNHNHGRNNKGRNKKKENNSSFVVDSFEEK